LEIISVSANNVNKVKDFLNNIPLLGGINDAVLMNGEFVYDQEIIGLLSFEEFFKIGLIRYFVFQKIITKEIIKEMFMKIIDKAKEKNLISFIALVIKKEAKTVFLNLGFHEINNNDVYIDETNLNATKYKNAVVLKYDVV